MFQPKPKRGVPFKLHLPWSDPREVVGIQGIVLTVRDAKYHKMQTVHFNRVSITLPPGKLDCKRVRVAPGVNGPGRKLDPLHFAEEKSVESVTESEEDLEPWEQTVADEHLPPQETGPGLPSTGSAPAGVETPSILEGTPHPLDDTYVQDGEADTVVRTRDLRGGGDGRFLQVDGRGQPGDRQDTSSASASSSSGPSSPSGPPKGGAGNTPNAASGNRCAPRAHTPPQDGNYNQRTGRD